MKIILLNITGRFGSTGKIINDLRDFFITNGHSVSIAYGHADKIDDPGFFQVTRPCEAKIISQITKLGRARYKGNPFAVKRIKKIIDQERPDIIHIHCINGLFGNIYKLFRLFAKRHIKTVITHHAEFFYTGSCGYAFNCYKFIDTQCVGCENKFLATGNRFFANPHKSWLRMYDAVQSYSRDDLIFTAVSPWVDKRSMLSHIVNRYPHKVVMNGIDTGIYFRRPIDCNFIELVNKRVMLRLDAKIALHVTHEFAANDIYGIKGGGYITALAKIMPEIDFIVVASVLTDTDNLPSNLHIWGSTEDRSELAHLYSMANITVIASKAETFSMIVAESLCCGTPIAGFKAGGPESIAIADFSRFVDYADVKALANNMIELMNAEFNRDEISTIAKGIYSKECMATEYMKIYESMLTINKPTKADGSI